MTARTSNVVFLGGWNLARRPLVIAILAATSCFALDQTLWEGKTGRFYSRVVVWDAARLTEPNLRLYYQQLSRELNGSRAWTVDVFVDRDDAAREVSGKMVSEKGYDWWFDLYNRFGRKLLPMAEIQGYGDNGVLQLRDRGGICSEIVLSGENFLAVKVNDVKFDILKVYYRSLPPHTEPAPGDEAMISVYVRSSTFPTVEQAREFTRLMQKRFQQKRVMVAFRTDAFFLTDGVFPIMYRFDSAATPPSREQYEKTKTMYCFFDRPGIPCR